MGEGVAVLNGGRSALLSCTVAGGVTPGRGVTGGKQCLTVGDSCYRSEGDAHTVADPSTGTTSMDGQQKRKMAVACQDGVVLHLLASGVTWSHRSCVTAAGHGAQSPRLSYLPSTTSCSCGAHASKRRAACVDVALEGPRL